MIKVLIPSNNLFEYYKDECKKLYELNQNKICDTNNFDFVANRTFFYSFLTEQNILIGCIYCFVDTDGKLFVNGFAKRKMYKYVIECLNLVKDWFSCDIYAEAQNKASVLVLLRCGYKRYNKNLFIYKNL